MDEQQQPEAEMTEEELRAAYEEQLKRVRVEDVLVQTVVSLLNLGGRKAGLSGPTHPTEDEKDLEQVRQAIEATRALLPMVEGVLGPDAKQLRDVLAQLQMAYARDAPAGATPLADPETGDSPAAEGGPPPASGRIWVPGQ